MRHPGPPLPRILKGVITMPRKKKKVNRKKRARAKRLELKPIQSDTGGVDIGSQEHWAGGPQKEDGEANVERFGATTVELHRMARWFLEQGVTSVAVESTGVYWIPVVEVLEDYGIETLIGNARNIKHVPGRKSDVQDCQWLQLLHAHGLLQGSFRPARAFCELRELARTRDTLVRERADWIRRIQKSLDHMNVRVHRAVNDITGVTGMRILRAIVDGERDPKKLAALRDGRCHKDEEQFAEQLRGTWRREHLFTLKTALEMYDTLSEKIAAYNDQIHQWMNEMLTEEQRAQEAPEHRLPQKKKNIRAHGQEPLWETLYRLCGVDLTGIDGVGIETALIVVTEIGTDMSRFDSEKAIVSYLTLAPHTATSGGKRLPAKRASKTCSRVAQALKMAANGLQNSRSALGAQFRRLASRKGRAVAIFAMARKLGVLIYRLLRHGQAYVDEGMEAFEARHIAKRVRASENTLKSMGYKIIPPDQQPVTV